MKDTPESLSVVTPAYNEARNLPEFYRQLKGALDGAGVSWEWVVVDDHSEDDTFDVIANLAASDPRVRGIRLTRNFGSHAAIVCGLKTAQGKAAAVLASDLQDPPKVIGPMIAQWREGFPVVWAVRTGNPDTSFFRRFFSRAYYKMLRQLGNLKMMPPTGADFFLVDRQVMENLFQCGETYNDLFALIHWMGFPSAQVSYQKGPRRFGASGWSFGKKMALFFDALSAFTDAPLRWTFWIGLFTSCLGFLYALMVVVNAGFGKPPLGWSSLMVVMLLLGGVQMLMIGLLGQYVWRSLGEARRRPRYIVEKTT